MDNIVHLGDCMDGMKQTPDKFYELAIVDPPYGIGIDGQKSTVNKNPKHNRKYHAQKEWDVAPSQNYFDELFRVSQNQIICGANYFVEFLTPSKGWVFWFKGQTGLTMSDGEFIYTSFDSPSRQITINRIALLFQNTIHPTEKPLALYEWLLKNYAKAGDKILDTHVGSGSSRIAAWKHGYDFTGYELGTDYHAAQEKRFNDYISQERIFPVEQIEPKQMIAL